MLLELGHGLLVVDCTITREDAAVHGACQNMLTGIKIYLGSGCRAILGWGHRSHLSLSSSLGLGAEVQLPLQELNICSQSDILLGEAVQCVLRWWPGYFWSHEKSSVIGQPLNAPATTCMHHGNMLLMRKKQIICRIGCVAEKLANASCSGGPGSCQDRLHHHR